MTVIVQLWPVIDNINGQVPARRSGSTSPRILVHVAQKRHDWHCTRCRAPQNGADVTGLTRSSPPAFCFFLGSFRESRCASQGCILSLGIPTTFTGEIAQCRGGWGRKTKRAMLDSTRGHELTCVRRMCCCRRMALGNGILFL